MSTLTEISGFILIVILLILAAVYAVHMIPGLGKALGCLGGDTSTFCAIFDTLGAVTGAAWAAKKLGITKKFGKGAEEAKEAGKAAEEAKEAGKIAEEARIAKLAEEIRI